MLQPAALGGLMCWELSQQEAQLSLRKADRTPVFEGQQV